MAVPVRLLPTEVVAQAKAGQSLMAVISAQRLPIARACGGRGVCDSCRVRVVSGAGWLAPPSAQEQKFEQVPGWRLACLARIAAPDAPMSPAPEATAPAPLGLAIWCPTWGPDPDVALDP